MEEEEIEKLLDRLIGETEPYGDETIDKERYENLLKWKFVFRLAYGKIDDCVRYRNDKRESVNKIGIKAYETFVNYREYIALSLEEPVKENKKEILDKLEKIKNDIVDLQKELKGE